MSGFPSRLPDIQLRGDEIQLSVPKGYRVAFRSCVSIRSTHCARRALGSKGSAKIPCFPCNFVAAEFHDAQGLGRLTVICQDVFGDPKVRRNARRRRERWNEIVVRQEEARHRALEHHDLDFGVRLDLSDNAVQLRNILGDQKC
jgi:hypothetical protein